jgi:hypothetical protein
MLVILARSAKPLGCKQLPYSHRIPMNCFSVNNDFFIVHLLSGEIS